MTPPPLLASALCIHPKWKAEVGRRLSLGARRVSYGEPVCASGPVAASATVVPAGLRVSFTVCDGGAGIVVRNQTQGGRNFDLRLAGAKKWSQAEIVAHTHGSVTLAPAGRADAAAEVVAVRYLWSEAPCDHPHTERAGGAACGGSDECEAASRGYCSIYGVRALEPHALALPAAPFQMNVTKSTAGTSLPLRRRRKSDDDSEA